MRKKVSANSTDITIGSVEIVEVSDVVSGDQPDQYTVGFKYRFKPNSLGEIFNFVKRPDQKSIPAGVRKLIDDPMLDGRISHIALRIGADGLMYGRAELTSVGSFWRKWKITHVYFDSFDKAKYTYHRVG